MITINYRKQIQSGQAPYSYRITGSNSCVNITPNIGTSLDGVLIFDVAFDTEACILSSDINITGSDANGCPFAFTITPANDCDSLTLSPIVFEAPYSFSVSASRPGCTQGLTFNWRYDETLFDVVSNSISAFTSELTLVPKSTVFQFPSTTNISAEVTDCFGCTKTSQYEFSFCQPQVRDVNTELYCINGGNGQLQNMERQSISLTPVTGCTGITIDWTTLSISNPIPNLLEITNHALTGGTPGTISIFGDLSLQGQTITLFWSVATTDGIRSNQGRLIIRVLDCSVATSIFIQSDVVDFPCDSVAGDTVYFNVDDYITVSPGATIDWASFNVLNVPVSSSPSITLEVDLDGNHRIAYVLPTPIATDTFAWSLCTTAGDCAEAAIFTVVECTEGPTAVDDEACSICGETIEINVQANDIPGDSAIMMGSTTITSISTTNAGSVGTALVLPNGNILYTPSLDFIGTVLITYTVQDQFGSVSNEATVTVEMICAGTPTILSVCQ